MPPAPPKPKIKVRPYNPGAKPSNPVSTSKDPVSTSKDPVSTSKDPVSKTPVSKPRRKGLIGKVVEIIINDIKQLPSRIVHGKKVVKKVKMPESNETWKDWEGEI